jgi:hypothetical protein
MWVAPPKNRGATLRENDKSLFQPILLTLDYNSFTKLGVNSRAEAVAVTLKLDLLPLSGYGTSCFTSLRISNPWADVSF